MKRRLVNCRLGPDEGIVEIVLRGGVIESILDERTREMEGPEDSAERIDCEGMVLMPGFIDLHVHLREPGLEYKEDVKSGTMAAAKGGYTTIFSMPNTRPAMDDRNRLLNYKKTLKSQARVKVIPVCAISKDLKGEELTDIAGLRADGAGAFSDDGRPVYDDRILEEAMKQTEACGSVIFDHCEDMDLVKGGVINEGPASQRLSLKGISNDSEAKPILRDLRVAETLGGRIHICHVSTAESVEAIREAKGRGVRVTCEAGPHHFGLNDDILEEGFTDCKVNPPLRSETDRMAIIRGLADGTIDAIATDHAPHHKKEKGPDFYEAAFGISGIETAFSVSYTELVRKGYISFSKLIELMSRNPAEIGGLQAGSIRIGAPADLTLVDLHKEVEIDREQFLSKGHNTPFHGRKYFGEVRMTWVDGEIVYMKARKVE